MNEKNIGGYILNGDNKVIADTIQCCHCGKHWIREVGSGKIRGYCTKCNKLTCGDIKCCECVPYEEQIERIEKGKVIIP